MGEKKINRRQFLKTLPYGGALAGGAVMSSAGIMAGAGTAQAASQKLKLKFAVHTGGTIEEICKRFKALVEKKSNGEIIINLYLKAQLGGEKDQIEGVRLGTIDVTFNSGVIGQWVPQAGVADLPFIYKDYEQAYRAINGPFIDALHHRFETAGFRTLGIAVNTPRETLAKKPLRTLDDWKNFKIRVPEVPIFIECFQSLGAVPTPVAWPEVYGALQTGIVDGVESAAIYLYGNKHYELCKYFIPTSHIFNQESIICSESWYRRQPEDVQNILMEAGKESFDEFKTKRWDHHREATQKMLDAGVQLVQPDREALARAVRPLHQKFADKYQVGDLLEKMQNA